MTDESEDRSVVVMSFLIYLGLCVFCIYELVATFNAAWIFGAVGWFLAAAWMEHALSIRKERIRRRRRRGRYRVHAIVQDMNGFNVETKSPDSS